MLNSTENEISTAQRIGNTEEKKLHSYLKCSDVVFILLINVKMRTIVDISTFMSMIN